MTRCALGERQHIRATLRKRPREAGFGFNARESAHASAIREGQLQRRERECQPASRP